VIGIRIRGGGTALSSCPLGFAKLVQSDFACVRTGYISWNEKTFDGKSWTRRVDDKGVQ
jgi:hypothetical protein